MRKKVTIDTTYLPSTLDLSEKQGLKKSSVYPPKNVKNDPKVKIKNITNNGSKNMYEGLFKKFLEFDE